MKDNTKQTLQGMGGCLLYICFFAGAIFLLVTFLKGAVWVGEYVYPWLTVISGIAFLVTLLVLFPLAFFRKTRGFAGVGLYSVSYLFGVTLWMTGLLLTYTVWGLTAVIIGLLLLIGGVVPFAIVATAFEGMWPPFWNLLFLLVLTYGCRMAGLYFMSKADEAPRLPAAEFVD